jgi:hypothetical protein
MNKHNIKHKKEKSREIFIQLIREKEQIKQTKLKKLYDQILKEIK